MKEKVLFVTGRLAQQPLEALLRDLALKVKLDFAVQVLPISVAALMSTSWIARHLQIPEGTTRVLLPGYCGGDLDVLQQRTDAKVERGPRDLRQIPELFGQKGQPVGELHDYSIEIIAEINHAPRLTLTEILELAHHYKASGADVIDVGCLPGDPWLDVGQCVKALRDHGFRVSIDSLQVPEIERAVKAGAELVLSVNGTNCHAAADWGCEVVVIPDNLQVLDHLDQVLEFLTRRNVPLRIDPILEPIGLGLAASLWRYMDVRRRYPEHAMMMGIGNLTEMTDVDSAGINTLLLGICQEVGVRSVLTTEVINWARTSVRECDLARRLVHHAVRTGVPAKHLMTALVVLRDLQLRPFGPEQLDNFATQMRDYNVRLLAENGEIHALYGGKRLADPDPFALFELMLNDAPQRWDPTHAFYLGYEMCKAALALQLGKEYQQDESMDWGYLTVPERWHRLQRHRSHGDRSGEAGPGDTGS